MNKLKKFLKNYYEIFIIILGLFVDQLTKVIAEDILSKKIFKSVKIIDNFFSFTLAYNKGAAWSILENQMWFFYIYTIIILIVITFLYFKTEHRFLKLSLSLIAVGALGNFIDRVYRRHVIDFFDFYIFNYDFPIFNVADIMIVSGGIGLAIYYLFIEGKNKNVIKG